MVPPCSFSHYEVDRNEFCSEDLEVDQRHLVSITLVVEYILLLYMGRSTFTYYFVADTLNWASTRNLSIQQRPRHPTCSIALLNLLSMR